jgi:DNA polymerase elongation subunit (family B)
MQVPKSVARPNVPPMSTLNCISVSRYVFIKRTDCSPTYSISVDYHYKFWVLLLLEADEKIEVVKHYFGITFDNELVVRGIEIRRHDVPAFIKRFQTQLLYTLFERKDSSEIHL